MSERFVADIIKKIEALESSLSVSNNPWNAWELEFIESIAEKLNYRTPRFSPKQTDTIYDLYDKL